jgi:hypothetical protein
VFLLGLFGALGAVGSLTTAALADGGAPLEREGTRMGFQIPETWARHGLVLPRQGGEEKGGVAGDPCIVWDEDVGGWRMFLFYDPPGHGQAVCPDRDVVGSDHWRLEGPLQVTNPGAVGGFHKPFVVMDPDVPNRAARVDGRYCLLVVSWGAGHKQVQRGWSERLAGPWTFEEGPLIPTGAEADFDAKHVDAVTGYYFAGRQEFLYFYMGYPAHAQARTVSPFGSAQAVATQKLGEEAVVKLGPVLEPCQETGHWASGWVGGLQLLRGAEHRWVAVVNASPTAPDPGNREVWTEEPPPSLGGFAWCDEEWPVSGWRFAPQPIEWIEGVPQDARDAGEGWNLWRQFIHILPDGRAALFYNSGYYGREQLYLKVSTEPTWRARTR